MVLWNSIYKKLILKRVKHYDIDVRYLQKWIKLYPELFPKFMLNNNYSLNFNSIKLRWEIYKIKI